MGDSITVRGESGALVEFNPQKAKIAVAGLEAAIKQATAMKDWAASDKAIDALIKLQTQFVAFWKITVSPNELLGRDDPVARLQQGLLSADEAYAYTGIHKSQVSRWQARLADPTAYRLALRQALQIVAMARAPQRDATGEVEDVDQKYRCLVVDPPWPMQKIARVVRPNQTDEEVQFDYATMQEDQLRAFGKVLNEVRAEDCHLFVWTTQRFMPLAQQLLEVWGARYFLTMVWHKAGGFQPIGLPQYNCEFVIYARFGTPEFVETKSFDCCFLGERREHSRKPDEFYETIKRVTRAPRLDMFSRGAHDGFDAWGNQTKLFSGDGLGLSAGSAAQ